MPPPPNLWKMPPKKIGWGGVNLQKTHSKSDFFSFFSIFAQNWLNIVFDPENLGFIGVWVLGLGVRVRMEGILY